MTQQFQPFCIKAPVGRLLPEVGTRELFHNTQANNRGQKICIPQSYFDPFFFFWKASGSVEITRYVEQLT